MDIIFLGGGGHAKSIIPLVLELSNKNINIVGYTDIDDQNEIYGVNYLGQDDIIDKLSDTAKIINCLGSTEKNNIRHNAYIKYATRMVGFISQNAIISRYSNVYCGNGIVMKNIQVMPGAIINSGVNIADNVIINSGAIIEHDCTIGVSSHIAPGATLCGSVTIGDISHIGANASILQNIIIGSNAVIGAGVTVRKNIKNGIVYCGNTTQDAKL